ncbi:hypothetical protein BBK36DRAFT_1136075 [Trichoderma citrinoviride]|uniref:Zn(2)-C6 fungal-type domain-containing protein n=1 Tax=Trichoderma citrinoviride TaxID=58853 RepID=A0A2T4B4Z6_9HYPO|nr:hypothetical protein BBK36DRAFT_1136075 [Trichoderma citrinoviride]PTB64338.1 hypothetical protein BBK36DRAFT_1136075 [Trichoderma citrinoviride]
MEPTNKGPKACTTCAKAKARCIPARDRGSKCQRCQRLNKECVSQRPAPPRAKKAPKRSRVAELEKRLDELSSQFADGGVVALNPGPRPSAPASTSSPTTANHLSGTERPGQQQQQRKTKCDRIATFEYLFPSPRSESAEASGWSSEAGCNDCAPGGGSGGAEASSSSSLAVDQLWPTAPEAEALLLQYHDTHAPLTPFVVIPRHLTAAELRRQRPFLWRVVMMVSCFFDGPRQHRLGKEVLAELASKAVLDGNKSLETLQGLLLIIGWLNYALRSAQLTNLLFLARSVTVNASSPGLVCGVPSKEAEVKWGELEYVRAYVGTYYVNAIVFNTNKKADAFMNTSQLDAFCNLLSSPGEYPSDLYLVKLVKIQMLSQSIAMATTFDPAQPPPMQLPLTMVVHDFQEQIEAYKASLPPHLVDNGTLQCHLAISQILLADISISDPHCSALAISHQDRIQLLWSCLHSLRRFYTVHGNIKCHEIKETEQRHFLGLTALDLAYAIVTGIKMLLVRVPGWDPQSIVSELGIREIVDQEIEAVAAVVARRKSGRWEGEEDPLGRMHKLLQYGRDLIDLQLQKLRMEEGVGSGGSGGADAASVATPAVANKEGAGGQQGWMMMGMEDLDDDLWQSFMNETAWSLSGEPMMADAFNDVAV